MPNLSPPEFIEAFVEAGLRYDCDKVIDHEYACFYADIFCGLDNEKPKLLEIGVGGYDDPLSGGASLRLWHDVLPAWQIFGVDLAEKRLKFAKNIKVLRADQSQPEELLAIAKEFGPFDVIIDDGSHINAHVRTSLLSLFPFVREAGWYVIEDTQTSYVERYGGSLDLHAETTANLSRILFDCVNEVELPTDLHMPPVFRGRVADVRMQHNILGIRKQTQQRLSNLVNVDIEQMLRAAQAALSPVKHGAGYWLRVSRYLIKLGRTAEALRCLQEGRKAHPACVELRQALAAIIDKAAKI